MRYSTEKEILSSGIYTKITEYYYSNVEHIQLIININLLVELFTNILSDSSKILKQHLISGGDISFQMFADNFYKHFKKIFEFKLLPLYAIAKEGPRFSLDFITSKKNAKYLYSIVYMLPRICYWYSNIIINIPSLIPIQSLNSTFHKNFSCIIYKELYKIGRVDIKNHTMDLTIIEKLNKNIKSILIFQKKYLNIWDDIIEFYKFFLEGYNFPMEIYTRISLYLT